MAYEEGTHGLGTLQGCAVKLFARTPQDTVLTTKENSGQGSHWIGSVAIQTWWRKGSPVAFLLLVQDPFEDPEKCSSPTSSSFLMLLTRIEKEKKKSIS